jgi:23S rRNA (adenine2503-C2)-methyltransferase
MKIISKIGRDDIANVYLAEINGKKIEFVESVQPPIPREKKWVLIISSLCGCPVKCKFCDAGGFYSGKLSSEELLAQIDFMVKKRFASNIIPVDKFKIQFARVGEPTFNENVLDLLRKLPVIYDAKGLIPSISTVAPVGTEKFFDKLLEIKKNLYKDRFQLQFSIHSTDKSQRDELIPVKKWDFEQIAQYGDKFYQKGDRKITLNFAVSPKTIIEPKIVAKYFDKEKFLIKITPVNPTVCAVKSDMASTPSQIDNNLLNKFEDLGYKVILSIGELEENNIGSNCGQYISNYEKEKAEILNSYTYQQISLQEQL